MIKVRVIREDFRRAAKFCSSANVCRACVIAEAAIRLGLGDFVGAKGEIGNLRPNPLNRDDWDKKYIPSDQKAHELLRTFDGRIGLRVGKEREKADKVYADMKAAGLLNLEYEPI